MNYLPGGLSMWARARALIDEAERRHRGFFELLVSRREPAWEPPVDIFMLEGELQVVVALPGVRADQIAIELSAEGLLIRAESQLPRAAHQARIVRLEIPYGHIERRIPLPEGRYRLLGHELNGGCLLVRLAGEWL